MGKRNVFFKKKKVFACLLAVAFLMGEILQPVSFLKAEEETMSGIEISVVTIEGQEATASGSNLKGALSNLVWESKIQFSQIKELIITDGQIKEEDWTYIFKNNEQFSNLTDFCAEGTGRGEGAISTNSNVWGKFPKSIERVEIPDGITAIGANAFQGCQNMQEITIPGSVKMIGQQVFDSCSNLVKVNLSEGLETIGFYAFQYCRKLERIKIPDSVTEIGQGTFFECEELKEVILPQNLITIGDSAFHGCISLIHIAIPDSVATIGFGAFLGCRGLRKFIFPKSLESINDNLFENCSKLKKVVIPGNIKEIGSNAFYGCSSLKEIMLKEGLETIGSGAFRRCSGLEKVIIPEGVGNISAYTFADCDSLTEITIPSSVTSIGTRAFQNCSKLSVINLFVKNEKEVTAITNVNTYLDSPFTNCPTPRRIYFYTEEGLPLSESTVPAFSDVVAAYMAVRDNDTTDDLWWGWQMEEAYSVFSRLTNLTESNEAAVWRKIDGDYTTTLVPAVSTEGVSYTLPAEVEVRIGDHTASSGADYTYDPIAGTLLVKAASIDGNIEIKAEAISSSNSVSSPSPDPTMVPTPAPTAEPTLEPTSAPTAEPLPDSTPTSVLDKDVSDIANGLGVSGETAQKIQEAAKELDVSKDTILVTDHTITSQKTDTDIKGAYFARIQARASKTTEKNIELVWNKVKGADGYLVYGNRCNTKKWIYEYKLAKTITNGSKCSFVKRKCKKGSYYKFIVRAYKKIDGKKVTIAVSKTIHVVTEGGKNGNAGSIKANKSSVSLKKGKIFQIKVKEVKQKKKLQHHRKACYESSNPNVASVSKKGVIKAKKKGKCTVYIYAQNGIYKKVKVTVK